MFYLLYIISIIIIIMEHYLLPLLNGLCAKVRFNHLTFYFILISYLLLNVFLTPSVELLYQHPSKVTQYQGNPKEPLSFLQNFKTRHKAL